MRTSTLTALALACTATVALIPAAAIGGPNRAESTHRQDDDDAAEHRAVLNGDVLPMARILTLATGYQAGHVIEIDLDSKRSGLTYDVNVLTADGRLRELVIDARNGKLITNRADDD
ncbi:MAG: PepSY domain-containing protein [Sphingobium sp.]|jgi:uncharacterized membrane protein YkoI